MGWNRLLAGGKLIIVLPRTVVSPMAAADLETILNQAKSLSEPDRARLAHDLLATLDGRADSGVAAAWEHEVARRLAEVENGTAKTISREELTKRLRNRTD